ncbi:HET-domain-containing protein [Daldinia caldariorum]|uniref:HET-domain-containing protein n=1 Tax=Daldinia caldariorum TaxID=326644 RepID=UPI002007A4C5|nr:HET-domain-containing protein [Daldinia caldariorum]KAI1472184.1 HET-domain-containing protein [Daldinia caldariorum]
MLCAICVNFDVRKLLLTAAAQPPKGFNDPTAPDTLECLRPAVPRFFEHHPNLLSLRSAADKCDLCASIWQAYASNTHPWELVQEELLKGISTKQIFVGTTAWDATLSGMPHISVIQEGEKGAIRTLALFEVCAQRCHEPADNSDLLARSIYSNSGSKGCLQLAAELLGNCINKHKSCSRQYPASSKLPTRIIDVEGTNPKLVDGGGKHETFAALSYCWGGDSEFILTGASEQLFRQGRPLSNFPATIRDAISITKAPGIRYIWIDALCIIQDSREDWAQEASRMRDVYRGAVVTIAAACAAKTTEGIFRERAVSTHPECWLNWKNGDSNPPKVFLRLGSELWDERMHQSVLNTRGWVLQETLLAPRTLWFGQQQICLECPKGSVDETGRTIRIVEIYRSKEFIQLVRREIIPGWRRQLIDLLREMHIPLAMKIPSLSLPTIIHARDLETIRHRAISWKPFTLQGYFKPPANIFGFSHFDFWLKIIENYSSRQLSQATDVLTALSGLAREFHQATGDMYVAGLWKRDIIQGLTWSRFPVRKKLPDGRVDNEPTLSNQYLAPSWSWASILGKKVLFMAETQFDHVKQFAEVLDIDIQTATHDPFGAVKGGSLTLRAPFLELDSKDLFIPPDSSSRYPKLSQFIFDVLKSGGGSEYGQKHRGYAEQKFAILKLVYWRRTLSSTERACFLILESVQDSNDWRRIESLNLTSKETVLWDSKEVLEKLAILDEIKHALKRHVVRII